MTEKEKSLNINKTETKGSAVAERTKDRKTYVPMVDISEIDNGLVIFADIPGADEKNVHITLENDLLTIEAQVEDQTGGAEFNNHKLTYGEYGVGDFYRAFTINETIDRDKIEAKIKNGVLNIILPKADSAKPKSIPIQVG